MRSNKILLKHLEAYTVKASNLGSEALKEPLNPEPGILNPIA